MLMNEFGGWLRRVGCCAILGVVCATLVLQPPAQPALAQATLPPSTNLSFSGSASLPAIGIAPNGRLHALWWDQLDGTRYSRGTVTPTQTIWSKSVIVPGIAGLRRVDQNTRLVTLLPPTNLQILADGVGAAHAVWFNNESQLMYSQAGAVANAAWSTPAVLAAKAASVALSLDISGTLRIAFVQTSDTQQSPAGVYYLVRAGNTFRRSLVFASTYFRTARPEEVSLSVASDVNNAIVAWTQVRDGSFSTRTQDGGKTWTKPSPIVPRDQGMAIPVKTVVGVEGMGKFILMWRDASAPGCGLFQKESADAGQTWNPPQRALTQLIHCPERWQMVFIAEGQVALVGVPSMTPTPDAQTGLLAFWNGRWSQPMEMTLLYHDGNTNAVREAGCISLSFTRNQLATMGCDVRGDVWANVQAVDITAAVGADVTRWEGLQRLTAVSDTNSAQATGNANHVAMTVNQNGRAFAVWSMTDDVNKPATRMQLTMLSAGRWNEPKEILNVAPSTRSSSQAAITQVTEPSIAAGNDDKLHLVWSGGESGRVFYSAAFQRDALDKSSWQTPVMLPSPSPIGASPQIIADAKSGRLAVLFAVPYNEGRGVYLTQSSDGGKTWLTPTSVFDAMAAGWDAVGDTRLALDPSKGVFHALWLKMPLPGARGERELFYSRSEDSGRTWSQPARIDGGQIEKPSIQVIEPDHLMVTWHKQAATNEQPNAPWQVWWQVSPQGGNRWTQPMIVTDFNAVSGSGLGTDGAGHAYLAALGQGISGEAALLYSEWSGAQWSKVEVTSLSQPAAAGNGATLAVLSSAGQLQNLMRLSTLQQDGRRMVGVAAIARSVQAAQVQPLPTFTPAPLKANATPSLLLPDNTPEPTPEVVSGAAPAAASDMPVFIVLGAGLAMVVLIGGIVISFIISRRR